MPHYELNLRDYWRIIKKKKIIVIVTVIMLSGFSMMFAIINRPDPLYRVTSSLKIEKSTNLTGLYLYNISWGSGDDLATRAEEIKSYPILEEAAKEMGLIDSAVTSEEIRNNKDYLDIVTRLKARVKTEQEGFTNIINIIVTDQDPVRATNLANALAKVYERISFEEKNIQAKKALDAVRNQKSHAERVLRESELKVRNYREQNKFITMDGTASRLSTELNAAEANLEKIRGDISQIDNILKEIDQNREYIYGANLALLLSQSNRFLEDMQNNLNKLRSDLTNYSQHYTPQHPVIKDLQLQIKNNEKRFVNELKTYRQNLSRAEKIAYEKWQKIDEEYKSLPLLSLTLTNLERERDINTQIYAGLESKYQEALIRLSEQVKEVFIIRPAFVPTSPINPTMIGPTTAIGTIIGLILGIVLAFVAETLDTTFSTIDDIEKTLDTTVMGIVPFVDIEALKSEMQAKISNPVPDEILEMQARLVSHYNPKSTMAESFRALRTNVHFALLDKGYKTVMVTSSVASEGKTTVAVNLAVSMAQIGVNTLLVETDLRKPRVSKLFGIEREPGLTDIVLRKEPIDTTIRTMSDLLMGTMASDTLRTDGIAGIEYLNILTSGKIERNPSEIIASKLMDNLVAELKERYDLVIFDSAPVIQATDSTVLGSKVDTVLLVYYQGKISRGTLRRSKSQLELLKSDILGVIVNGMKADISADYSDYKYSYEYHYQEEEKTPQNKYVAALSQFFLKPTEGLPGSIFAQINKVRAGLALLLVGAIIGSGIWAIGKLRSAFSKKPTPVRVTATVTSPATQPETTATVPIIPDTMAFAPAFAETVQVIPAELKRLQNQLGIVPAPEQKGTSPVVSRQTPSRVMTAEEQARQTTSPMQTTSITSAPTFEQPGTKPAAIRHLPGPHPYTVVVQRAVNPENLKADLAYFRQKGLPAFITTDFSNPERKTYMLCYGSFISTKSAVVKAQEFQFLGLKGLFQPLHLPITILIGQYNSKAQALKAMNKYPPLADNLYLRPITEDGQYYVLYGGFPSIALAEMVQLTQPLLNDKEIVYR